MKIFFYIILFLSSVTFAQETSDITYRVIQTDMFFKGGHFINPNPNILIEFKEDKIISTTKDQTRNLYLVDNWKNFNFEDIKVKGKKIDAFDNGGFSCLLNYAYDSLIGHHFISICYGNVTFLHWIEKTNERIYREPEMRSPHNIPKHIEYTDEEIEEFWENFWFLKTDFYSLEWLD